jgi:hypothetical protein
VFRSPKTQELAMHRQRATTLLIVVTISRLPVQLGDKVRKVSWKEIFR